MNVIPWLTLMLIVILATVGQLSLKYAFQASVSPSTTSQSKLHLLTSPYLWSWLICYVLVTGFWLFVLRTIPLSQAFPALGLTFALVPLGSRYLLNEEVVVSQWVGIAIIIAGAVLVVQG
jgi:undecaprenyl phosphate-alpha-L-ara4N flippase subunit ArnE